MLVVFWQPIKNQRQINPTMKINILLAHHGIFLAVDSATALVILSFLARLWKRATYPKPYATAVTYKMYLK